MQNNNSGQNQNSNFNNNRGNNRNRRDNSQFQQAPSEFEEKIVHIRRVSKKTTGGNKMGFTAHVVVGDRKGRVGVGLGKAPDVSSAIRKGSTYAKKHLITVPLINGTIPHEIYIKEGAAKILLKPAPAGSGVIAGGAVRSVVEAAGVLSISSKVLGTNNKASNVQATLLGLSLLKPRPVKVKPQATKVEKKTETSEKETVSETKKKNKK